MELVDDLGRIVMKIISTEDPKTLDMLVDRLVEMVGYGEHVVKVYGEKYVVRIREVEHHSEGIGMAVMASGVIQEVKTGIRAGAAVALHPYGLWKLLYIWRKRP